jgi:HAD domain in Swiss Army Knife RNA repair proteins
MPKSPRDREIKRWLRQHRSVKRFVVINDEANELDDLPLFQPSGKTGLTAEIAKGIERYFAGDTDRTMRVSVAKRMFQDISSRLSRNKR